MNLENFLTEHDTNLNLSSHAWQHHGVVLAAGSGRRFGEPKAPVVVEGERLVDRAVRVLRQGGCSRVLVVLGAWVGPVAGAEVIVNTEWRTGMGSSLRCGLRHLSSESQLELEKIHPRRAVITLVDLPGLTPAAIHHICDAPGDLLAATYCGIQGHPVLIGDYHWNALIKELDGDSGARYYLARHGVNLISLDQFAKGDDLDYPLK